MDGLRLVDVNIEVEQHPVLNFGLFFDAGAYTADEARILAGLVMSMVDPAALVTRWYADKWAAALEVQHNGGPRAVLGEVAGIGPMVNPEPVET